jgi:hypothetical protein
MIVGDSSSWEDLFPQDLVAMVLSHVVETWERMPKPRASELEDNISIKLYSALVKSKDRNNHAFLIRYQDVEVDTDLAKLTGRKDIVVYPSTLEEIYFCLEAKRLNALISGVTKSLADEYVKEGMQRFVDGKYSRSVRHGAMLAYVLDGQTNRAMTNVENNIHAHFAELRMEANGGFTASGIRPHDPCSKETRHQRAHEDVWFRIHHLFLAGAARSKRTPPNKRSRN